MLHTHLHKEHDAGCRSLLHGAISERSSGAPVSVKTIIPVWANCKLMLHAHLHKEHDAGCRSLLHGAISERGSGAPVSVKTIIPV